ncbi:MAG: transporter substrate-binding domain-containing protein [Clostridia bacterium]|nr:transporter substrate-binding domain-containing protein [Clostridia bacterium]
MKLVKRVLTVMLTLAVAAVHLPHITGFASRVVRVGYCLMDGYYMLDEYGEKSGFGYEFLQNMRLYVDWNYVYVGYEKSPSDMMVMLENGEIDMFAPVQKLPEREEKFAFSKLPLGTASTILSVKEESGALYRAGNYDTYNGMRIGIISGSSQVDTVESFAQEKGFSYIPVFYETEEDLKNALENGDVDAIADMSIRVLSGEYILDSFSPYPFYIMTAKDNTELMGEIDYALERLSKEMPTLSSSLMNKYYASASAESIMLTPQEREYIQKCYSEGTTFSALLYPDHAPYSYFENGQMRGINVELAQEMIRRTGLNIKIITAESAREYRELIDEGRVEILMDVMYDYNRAEREDYYLTQPYNASSVSMLTRKRAPQINSVATTLTGSVTREFLLKMNILAPEIKIYPDVDACVDAVKNGEADAMFLYGEWAKKVVYEDEQNILIATAVEEECGFAIGVSLSQSAELASIMNKAALSISDTFVRTVADKYTQYPQRTFSLIGYMYTNPVAAIILALALFALLMLLLSYLFRRKRRAETFERAKEHERFVSYICASRSEVAEIDLHNKTKKLYSLTDGKVSTQEAAWDAGEYIRNAAVHPDDIEKIKALFTKERIDSLIASKATFRTEFRLKTAGGVYRRNSVVLTGIPRDDKHPRNVMLFRRDIEDEERDKAQKDEAILASYRLAQRYSVLRQTLISKLSREIWTPLNAIVGYTAIAKNSLFNQEKTSDCLNQIERSTKQLIGILDEAVDVSEIAQEGVAIENEPFNLKELLTDVTDTIYSQASQMEIEFNVILNQLKNERLCGDSGRIKKILMNLLSNALRFTPRGGQVSLTVTQKSVVGDIIHFTFTVKDTGIGISKDFLEHIFTPFMKTNPQNSFEMYEGAGLGLVIVRSFVDLMHGTIDVVSTQGRGSTFTVELPILDRETAPEELLTEKLDRKVIVADKDNDTCVYVRDILTRLGAQTYCLNNVEEAERMLSAAELSPGEDICVADSDMLPDIIKHMDNQKRPLIVAMGYSNGGRTKEKALLGGADAFVAKPVFFSSMLKTINDELGIRLSAKPHTDFGGMRILLVSDNEKERSQIASWLRRANCEISEASSAQEAEKTFENGLQSAFGLVILNLEGGENCEAARKIRSLSRADAQNVRILEIAKSDNDITAALLSGINGGITAPIDEEKLYKTITQYIGQTQD